MTPVHEQMDEETEGDPHGHITSLAVKRSHRRCWESWKRLCIVM